MFFALLVLVLVSHNTNADQPIIVQDTYLTPDTYGTEQLAESFSSEKDLQFLPNVSTSKGSNKTQFLQVRGLGQRENFSPLIRRYNKFYLDHIDYTEFPQAFEHYCFSKAKFNYGPSLLGAAGATFTSSSSHESHKNHLKAEFSAGSFGYESQKGAYQSSKKTFLNPSFSVMRIKEDGFYENTFLNRDDTNNRDEFYLRTNLFSPVFYNQKISYRFHYNRLDNGYDAFVQDNSKTMVSDHPGQDDLNMQVHQLGLHSNKKNKLFFEYMKSHSLYSYDEDWGNDPKWLNFDGFNYPYNYFIEFIRNKERYSINDIYQDKKNKIELRYMQSKESHLERGFADEAPRSNIDTLIREQNISLAAERSLFLNDDFDIKLGLGIQTHTLEMSNLESSRQLSEELFNGIISANYKSFYTNLKSSEVPGGVNIQSAVPNDRAQYKKERVSTLETGVNFNNRFSKNKLNLFYTIRNNPQVKTSYQANPNDPSTFTFYNDNTSSATHYGAEVTNAIDLTRWFRWNSSLSLLKTSFGNYPFGERNLKDRELPNSPDYQLHLKPTIMPTKRSSLSIGYYQQDNYYFSNSHDQRGKGYSLVNLEMSYAFNKAKLTFSIENLFDEKYQTRGFFFGNNPPNFQEELFTQQGRPRFVGLKLDMAI